MNANPLIDRLLGAGLDAEAANRTRALFEVVTKAAPGHSRTHPLKAWWIPGRLEVFGKHTDYCGGHSLVAAIPRGFALAARARDDDEISVYDAGRGERLTIPSAAPAGDSQAFDAAAIAGWRRYATVVVHRLRRNFPGAALGADLVLASNLPSAAGMSSSSALVVGLVRAFAELGALHDRVEWRDNIRGPEDEAGYYACFENGFTFGTLAGDGGVGTHGGSEDHVAIVCGVANEMSAWQFVPIRHVARVTLPEPWTFVIASSGVAAQKIGAAREKYNSLSNRARAMLELWNSAEPPQPSLFAAVSARDSAAARLRELVQRHAQSTTLLPRLDQFLGEDRRVLDAVEAFRCGDRDRLGELSDASQRDAERLLGNQIPETIALAHLARDLGALASSSFGAGFGGSVWALVERRDASQFADRWLDNYRARFPFRTAAIAFVARPGPGLMRLE